MSDAADLVPDDHNALQCPKQGEDVFVHDRLTGQTELVSVSSDGQQYRWASVAPAISANGRYVAFVSSADNLVAGDTNGAYDVFVHDCVTGRTTRVSLASDGTQGGVASTVYSGSCISADGRYVAFVSGADNLVPNDTNGLADIFVRDREPWQPPEYGASATTASATAVQTMGLVPASRAPAVRPNAAPARRLPGRVGFLPRAVREALTFGDVALLRHLLSPARL